MAVKALDEAKAVHAAAVEYGLAASKVASEAADIDLAPILARSKEATAVNERVRAKKAKAEAEFRAEMLKANADLLTTRIEEIDAERVKRIGAAALPVPGLGFDGDGNVTLNDLPFSQASQAEQLRVSLAMGAALQPTLRLIIVKDGSLLDAKSLGIVGAFARDNDLQILMERVGDGAEVGVVIEDGAVLEDRRASNEDAGEQGRLGL